VSKGQKYIRLNFVLPLPPSVNKAFPTNWKTKRRYLSKEAKQYKKTISSFLLKEKKPVIISNICIRMGFVFKDNRRRDISNYIKVLEDCLVSDKIIIDDSKVIGLLILKKQNNKENPHVKLTIKGII
jgi:Holliday junction resolvase RusA-like endonuclease